MAADQTLVQGAYRAARAGAEADIAGLNVKTDIISGLTKGVTDYVGAVAAEAQKYDEYAQKVIDEAGMLSQEEASQLYDRLQDGRKNFIWGSKKDKAFSIREMNLQAGDYKDYEANRLKLAELKKDKTNGLSKAFLDNPENKGFLDMLDSSARLTPRTCPEGELNCPDKGRLGVEINGEWVSQSAITAKIEEGVVDTKTRELIGLWGQNIFTKSSKVQPGEVGRFNEVGETEKVKQMLANASNLQSIAKDPMFGITSFEEDRFAKLIHPTQGETYASLLGPRAEEYIKNTGTDISDGIQEDEAILLMDALMNDENALTEELTNYFVGFGENQHNVGMGERKELEPGYKMTASGRVVRDERWAGWQTDVDDEGDETEEGGWMDVPNSTLQYNTVTEEVRDTAGTIVDGVWKRY